MASVVVAGALVSFGVPRTAAAQEPPQTVIQGQSASRIITATGPTGRLFTFGTASSGAPSVSGLPAGATASFSPSVCTIPQSASSCDVTLTVTTTPATPTGDFPITVTSSASGGNTNASTVATTFTLRVTPRFDYSLAASPGNVTVIAGGVPGSTTITATLLAGATQAVSFSLSQLPTGVTATFSAPSCNPTCTTTLTITAAAGASASTSTVTVTGTSPNTPNKTTGFSLTVTPQPFLFSLAASPGNVTVTVGGAPGSTTITAALFAGATQAVNFSVSPLPAGVTATFSPLSCSPTCTTTLTFTAGAAASASTSTITVTGTNPGSPGSPNTTTARTTVTLTVIAPRALSIVSGNNQTGVINATLPNPLVVSVTPSTPSVTVTWEVTGGAIPSATSTQTVNGLAQITLRLGPTPGPVTVRASVSGDGGVVASSVTFVVNDATQTVVEGLKTYAVLGNLAVTTATVQSTNIGLRLAARRSGGGGGANVSGLSLNVAGQSVPLAAAVASFMSSGSGGGASADPSKLFGGLGIFLNGQGSFGDQEGTTREPGFKFHTTGLTLGADYQLTANFVLGVAAGYLHTAADLDQAGGRAKMSGYSLTAFGTYYVTDKFYVDAIATYGWNDYGITRNIASGETAKADPDGNQLAVSVSGGYNFNVGPLTVGPTARVNYVDVRIDGFQERGADIFNLRLDSQRIQSLTTALGAQASYAVSMPWGVLSPLVRAEWEHELKGGSRLITGSLAADPLRTPFSAPTNNPDRNYVNLAAGLTATLPRGVSAFVHYETVLGRAHVTNHSFTAGVRFQFE